MANVEKGGRKKIAIPQGKAKPLLPIRCPYPSHDKETGVPLRFGISQEKDAELQKRLIQNMRLNDIDKLVENASAVELKSEKKSARGKNSDESNEMSLVSAMASRLRHAEKAASELRDLLKSKDSEIAELKSALEAKDASANEKNDYFDPNFGRCKSSSDLAGVKEQNIKLRELLRRADAENKSLTKENAEMKQFLRDYGMEWVGESANAVKSSAKPPPLQMNEGMWNQDIAQGKEISAEFGSDLSDRSGPEALGIPFDPAQILSSVKQLNFIAGEGEKEVVACNGIRKLKEKAQVSYTFYQDGIFARGGPLRPYKLKESRLLVKDLMDGYFPWELKEEYPDGVPIKVEFRLKELYNRDVPSNFQAFKGEGHSVGAKIQGSASVSNASRNEIWNPPAANNKNKAPELLRNLPNSVVGPSGNIINVKDDIEKKLNPYREKPPREDAEVIQLPSKYDKSENDRTIVRVKKMDTNATYEVVLAHESTIAELKSILKSHIRIEGMILRTHFPAREYSDDRETMKSGNLVPNALLFITDVKG
eukprot:764027-Hanusia_phi.AAC.1